VTKSPGSRAAGVAMAFKHIEPAQTRWRAVNAPHLVALVRAGAVFKNGKLIERPDGSEGGDQQVSPVRECRERTAIFDNGRRVSLPDRRR
jgi:hypothetical protein